MDRLHQPRWRQSRALACFGLWMTSLDLHHFTEGFTRTVTRDLFQDLMILKEFEPFLPKIPPLHTERLGEPAQRSGVGWTSLCGIHAIFSCVVIDHLTGIDDPHGSCGQIIVDLFIYPFFFEGVSQDPDRISLEVQHRSNRNTRSEGIQAGPYVGRELSVSSIKDAIRYLLPRPLIPRLSYLGPKDGKILPKSLAPTPLKPFHFRRDLSRYFFDCTQYFNHSILPGMAVRDLYN